MLVKKYIKRKTLYLSHTHYILNLLFTYNIIKANLIGILMVKKSIILLSRGENAKFNITNY